MYLNELVQQIANEKGFIIQFFECVDSDYCNCFITAPPKLSITMIVKYLKGITGRKLLGSQAGILGNSITEMKAFLSNI